MDTTAELARRTKAHDTHLITIFLAKQGDSTQFLGFFHRHIAMFVTRQVLTDHVVDDTLYLAQLLVSHLLEVREVETQRVGRYKRTLLLHVVTQYLLQGIVEQVGSGVVGSRSVALVGIDTSHELGCGVFRQLLDDMNSLAVLAFGVDNLDGLVLRDEHTLITNLSTHLAIEWCGRQHDFVELILLLRHLAVAQNLALIFRVVVAYELLFASLQLYPVAILNGSGITGTLLLFLHLHVELLLVNGKTILTTNQLCQVEGETISVEHTEGLNAIKLVLALSLQFLHRLVEQGDTLVEGAQEGVFLLLDDLGNQLLLGLQLREGIAHLVNEGGDELIEETVLLSEEGVGVTYGTTQDTADDVAGLGVRGQLTIGNRERNSTKVVGADTHSHVDLLLTSRTSLTSLTSLLFKGEVLKTCNVLLGLDDGLEDVGIVVRVLALHHAYQALEPHTSINHIHRQLLETAVSLAVELHEHKVPDLDNLWVVLVDEFTTRFA